MSQLDDPRGTAPDSELRHLVDLLQRSSTDQVDGQLIVDPAIYSSPDVARQERERVFGRVPVPVCHSSELAEKGAFVTARLPNNQVLIVRQPDGDIRAFVNACRHRGALIEDRGSGVCPRRLQCPYHGWSYNLDGSLKSPTHQVSFGEFDHLETGLVRLPVEERHGFVWVVDRAGATIDVADWLGDLDAVLDGYDLGRLHTYKAGAFPVEANWKVLQDAFLDGYHIQFVHKDTAAKMTYTNVLTLEDFGRHIRFYSPRKSLGRLLDERADSGEELTEDEIRRHANFAVGLLPNATLLFLPEPDHFQLLTFYPDPKDPAKARMEMRVIVPPREEAGWDEERYEKIWSRNWTILMDVIRDEDFPIAQNAQKALESADAGPLIIGRNEIANHVFHRELGKLLDTE